MIAISLTMALVSTTMILACFVSERQRPTSVASQQWVIRRLSTEENVRILSKWPETSVRLVHENWTKTRDMISTFHPESIHYYSFEYKGLLVSTCQSVPMFSKCLEMSEEGKKRRLPIGATDYNWTAPFNYLYRRRHRPVVWNQWSTFDAFHNVMDCSQLEEKWNFFTSQICPTKQVNCTVRNFCSGGIECRCCEEIRCFAPAYNSYQLSASVVGEQHPNNGSLLVKNCTVATTQHEFTMSCTGRCNEQNIPAIGRFLNATCSLNVPEARFCRRKVHKCEGLACTCCDHSICYLKQPRGLGLLQSKSFTKEDMNIYLLGQMFGSFGRAATQKTDNNRTVMDKVVLPTKVVPDVHNLFPITTSKASILIVNGHNGNVVLIIFLMPFLFALHVM